VLGAELDDANEIIGEEDEEIIIIV